MSLNPVKFSIRNKKVTVSDNTEEKTRPKPVEIHTVTNELGKLTLKSKRAVAYETFDRAFSNFENKITQMNLGNTKTDKLIRIVRDLCDDHSKLSCSILDADFSIEPPEFRCAVKESLFTSISHLTTKLSQIDTAYKRKKHLSKNPSMVEPKEIAIGLKWRTKLQPDSDIPNYVLAQTTFQYVSVKESLLSLFRKQSFAKIYFDYNDNLKPSCCDGFYHDYCCGSVYKELNLAQHKNAVIIQLGFDDFDVCCPVKSKSTIHKMTAIYFQIRNFPAEFDSKLDCIFLVALCETENTKQKDATINNIFELVRNEMQPLGLTGLQINENLNVKAFLYNAPSDNLGENGGFGFVECFSMDCMCRFCEMDKNEWRTSTREVSSKMRTMESYQQALNYIQSLDEDEPINYKVSKGVKSICLLNDIDNFHILQNANVDLMHDVMEGLIPYFLEHFFKYCSEKKIVSHPAIRKLIRDYNYGFLFKRKLPSKIKTDSGHMNQNATQLYTIMLHLPFIFNQFRAKISAVIKPMTTLLQIMQILFSTTICESDIVRLETLIHDHLSSYQTVFKAKLSAKHHILTHYPPLIRRMGPVIHTWMMRFEAKHKVLASLGKTQCFKNIAQTIAERHQVIMCKDQFDICMFDESQRATVRESKFVDFLTELGLNTNDFFKLKFLNYNSFQYRAGLLFIEESNVYEILEVLVSGNSYSFICIEHHIVEFDSFFNSIKIGVKDSERFVFLKFADLKNKQSYQKTNVNGNKYVIADTLKVYKFE